MVEENRKINLHGTVTEKSRYKSYRVKSTPLFDFVGHVFLFWIMIQFYMWVFEDGFFSFSATALWYALFIVCLHRLYRWMILKLGGK